MIIWRAIYLNSLEELDKLNFGCHWTTDEFYPYSIEFIYNNISKNKRKGKNLFVFKTKVKENQINRKATYMSNMEYPSESECLLKINTFLPKVVLVSIERPLTLFNINTGNRCDNGN